MLSPLRFLGTPARTANPVQLGELGFLVEGPEAEADLMLYRHNCHRNNGKVLELALSPTRVFSYHCDYCYIKKRPAP